MSETLIPNSAASLPIPESEPGLPRPENKQFYPALDGLRAIAVLIVFFHHYRSVSASWLEWGWIGVDIFFVLSGFLITGILFDTRFAENRYRSFYARRTLRIFPLYYLVWLLALLATPILGLHWSPRWILWPLYLGNYTHLLAPAGLAQEMTDWLLLHTSHVSTPGAFLSFGHLWSLCVEEQFYLLWPVLVFAILDRTKLLRVCLIVVVAAPCLRAAALYVLPQRLIDAEILYRSTPFRCDALLIGAALALLYRGGRVDWLRRFCWPVFAATLASCILTGYLAVHLFHASRSGLPTVPWIATLGFSYVDIMSACLIVAATKPTSWLFRVLQWRPLPQLGRISYGFYVFHDIAHPELTPFSFRLLRHVFKHDSPFGAVLVSLLIIIIVATLSYRFFEKPFLRLKSRFPASSSGIQNGEAAPAS